MQYAQADYADNYDYLPDDVPDYQLDQPPLLPSSPQQPEPGKVTPKKRRLGKVHLDDHIEIDNQTLQTQIRTRAGILLPEDVLDSNPVSTRVLRPIRARDVPSLLDAPLLFDGGLFADLFARQMQLASPRRSIEAQRGLGNDNMDYAIADYLPDDNNYDPMDYTANQIPEVPLLPNSVPDIIHDDATQVPGSPHIAPLDVKDVISRWQDRFLRSSAFEDVLEFQEFLPEKNRKAAASTFYECLELAKKGLIRINQTKAYGRIEVEAMPELFSSTTLQV